jgi:hypothetical protein
MAAGVALASDQSLSQLFRDDPTAPAHQIHQFSEAEGGNGLSIFDSPGGDPSPGTMAELLDRVASIQDPGPRGVSGSAIKDRLRSLVSIHDANGDFELWAVPMTNGNICVFNRHDGSQGSSCTEALDRDHPITLAIFELPTVTRIYGLVADGVDAVTLTFTDGSRRVVETNRNAYLSSVPPAKKLDRAEVVSTDGRVRAYDRQGQQVA